MDVFLRDIAFYLISEAFSSFSSRSYPPVRKYCDMNMTTNMALKTRTRCYSFDQSVRKCNDRLVINMINKTSLYLRTEWYRLCYCCCETSCPPQQQEQGLPSAVPGLETTDTKLHCCWWWCCSPVLLLLWFGRTHAHKNCASDLWVEGIHTTSRDTPSRLRSKQALTSTVSQ